MKNKKLILVSVALVLVIAAMLGIYFATRPTTSQGSKTITVTVVHADGAEKKVTIRTDEEFLDAALVAEGLVIGEDSQYGLNIHTVDGEKASWEANQSYWALFIGEDYATTGVSQTPVNDGDSFKLVYTIG